MPEPERKFYKESETPLDLSVGDQESDMDEITVAKSIMDEIIKETEREDEERPEQRRPS